MIQILLSSFSCEFPCNSLGCAKIIDSSYIHNLDILYM